MSWSPNDKKSLLLKECEARGMDVDGYVLKSDLIRWLRADDLKKAELRYVEASLGKEHVEDLVVEPSPEPSQEPTEPTPVSDPIPAPKAEPGQAQSPEQDILDYLAGSGEKVPLKKILKDCGKESLDIVKKLVRESKVTQYKQHNNFWYKAR